MKNLRHGFTLIEVLVSVVILSVVLVGFIKIQNENISIVNNLFSKKISMYENTLFLNDNISFYNKQNIDAYTALSPHFFITNDKTKSALSAIKREITVERAKDKFNNVTFNKLILKDKNSTIKYTF